jgi:hypothetical protein
MRQQKSSTKVVSADSHTVQLLVRVTNQEKHGFEMAAALAGISVSAWVRERLRLVAIRELESAGKRAPFLEWVPLGGPND